MESIVQIAKWCHANSLALTDDRIKISELATDSRHIEHPESALFIALKTGTRDGHDFIEDAWKLGVRNFLVSQAEVLSKITDSNVLQVTDTLVALQQIATGHRKEYKIPVIGITGSNGKTIVKEWLAQILGRQLSIVRSPKSYNSQIGVPLSVWQMKAGDELAIFEAGISQPAEMSRLEKVILPTIGVFTNIGDAHSEGFMNQRQKISEKLTLFRHADVLIYSKDHALLHESIVQFRHQIDRDNGKNGLRLFSWSSRNDADVLVEKITHQGGNTAIHVVYNDVKYSFSIPFTDDASIENALHCFCVLLVLPVADMQLALAAMRELQPVSMRLELRQGINDCTIINDVYNSDLTSLKIALNFLMQQSQYTQHTVIMSDILQPGKSDLDLYDEVAASVSRRNVQRFIGVGPALYKHKAAFRKYRKMRSIFFKSTAHLLEHFHLLSFENEAILLKGARVFAFEKVAMLLEQKVHQTVMTIDLSALRHNLDVYRNQLGGGVKLMAMVKAFSYGSGSFEIARTLQLAGVDYLAVAYTDEGVGLRRAGIRMPIMVMSPDISSFDRMIAWKLEPEIYNMRSLNSFVQVATALQVQDYPVHLKMDTGMHRLGFNPAEIDRLAAHLSSSSEIRVASIFSHLAASDDSHEDAFTQQQTGLFREMSSKILEVLPYNPIRHLSNSAAISRHKDLQFDMVRLGLGLYGADSSGELADKLRQVSTLRTSIAQVRKVPAGESIGYGHHTIATKEMTIATICIGYADGYPRKMGHGKAYVLVNGIPAPTVGIICMDMCMVDVTEIDGVSEGDDAIVFSPELPVTQLARWAETIPYEIMTGISQRVKRVYVNEA